MTTINSQMGLKPRTRRRAATHAAGIVSHAQCPTCGGRHVIEHDIHAVPTRLCGFCGHTWVADEDADAR